jgi:Glycosyltransferase family 87
VLFWICLGYYYWKRGHPLGAGFVIVIAALIKLPTVFLLVVLLASRGQKPVLGASLAFAIILGVSLLINGIEINQLYFTEYLPEIIQTGHITSENSAIGNSGYTPAQLILGRKNLQNPSRLSSVKWLGCSHPQQ